MPPSVPPASPLYSSDKVQFSLCLTDMPSSFRTCVLFGGTGFIGSHLALWLLRHDLAHNLVLADIAPLRLAFARELSDPRVTVRQVDVRADPVTWDLPMHGVDLIVNLAAVHREPGHENHEYYETNLPGADNVCFYAEAVDCRQLIFTSSIAPYGPSEDVKTEASIPTPVSGYGGSKLAAEKIHLAWQRGGVGRRLVIVRPGVVFGPGEGGNVTRLVQASLRGYFMYMGNRNTRKAGGYVKELVSTMLWALDRVPEDGGYLLYNFSMPQPATVEEFVQTTFRVAGRQRFVPALPYRLLLGVAYLIEAIAKPFGLRQPISPVRVKKLVRSNNIQPRLLIDMAYPYSHTLESAMKDWKIERPDEWV